MNGSMVHILTVLCRAHPGPGAPRTAGTGPCKAVQEITVEYLGHTYVLYL